MVFTTPETTAYYTTLVKNERYDSFLAAMFLPPTLREAVIAIYSLEIELAHVHHVVKEEMIGHIRYAWWKESVESLRSVVAREQPVLQALAAAKVPTELLLPIVTAYQETFPNLPVNIEEVMRDCVLGYLNDKTTSNKWQKASDVISKHRAKYTRKKNNWLMVKLLFV